MRREERGKKHKECGKEEEKGVKEEKKGKEIPRKIKRGRDGGWVSQRMARRGNRENTEEEVSCWQDK